MINVLTCIGVWLILVVLVLGFFEGADRISKEDDL